MYFLYEDLSNGVCLEQEQIATLWKYSLHTLILTSCPQNTAAFGYPSILLHTLFMMPWYVDVPMSAGRCKDHRGCPRPYHRQLRVIGKLQSHPPPSVQYMILMMSIITSLYRWVLRLLMPLRMPLSNLSRPLAPHGLHCIRNDPHQCHRLYVRVLVTGWTMC